MAQRRFALLAVAFASAFVANAVGDFVLGPRFGIVAIAAVATTVLVLLSATVTVCALRGRGPRVGTTGWRSLASRVRRAHLDARKTLAPRRRPAPGSQAWVHVVVIAVVCTLTGVAVASVHQPILLLAVAGLVLTVIAVLLVWGELGIALFLVTATPLIPVVSGVYGQPKAYAGIDGSTLRTVGVAVLSAVALALAGRTDDRDRALLPLVRPLLLALSGLGLASALFTAVGPSDFVKQAAQATGQPLFYAVAITMFAVALSRSEDAREKLFEAWCLALVAEAIIVAGQVATGSAYDPIRGITRAQGTMGADSLGAFSMFGVFGALTLRSIASTRFARRLAGVAVVASLGMMFLSLARGPVIAFGVALGLLALRGGDQRSQRQLSRGFSLVALTGFVAYLTKDLWLARLSAPTTAGFDRPATWIAGFRIVRAHPVFGVGPSHIVALVQSSTQYGYTEFGTNAAVPHNSWLFAAAANGLPYAGLLVLATVAFVIGIHRAREPSGRFLRAGLIGLLLISFENNLFNHPETMLFVLLAAVASTQGLSRTSHSVATHPQGRMARRASQSRLPHARRALSAPLTQPKG